MVMRQFGLLQQFPLPVVHTVPPHVHQPGQSAGALWGHVMVPWVEQWEQALEDLVDEDREYDDLTYHAYLRWYVPATRTCVGYTPPTEIVHVPSVSDTYPQHHRQAAYQAHYLVRQSNIEARHAIKRIQVGIQMMANEVFDIFRRIYEKTTRAIRLTSCCANPGALAPIPTVAPQTPVLGQLASACSTTECRRGCQAPGRCARGIGCLPGPILSPSGRARGVRRLPGVFLVLARRARYIGWVSLPIPPYCRRARAVHSGGRYVSGVVQATSCAHIFCSCVHLD